MERAELELLGLNKYEAQAYEALVRLGKASAPEISQESGVPYGRIYDTLNSLVAKGLAIVIPEKAKKYAPGDPAKLIARLEQRKQELEKVQINVAELKKQYAETTENPVVIAQGKRNFHTVTNELPEPKQFTYHIKYTAEPRPEWIKRYKPMKSAGVDIKDLIRVAPDTAVNIAEWKKHIPKIDLRKLSNEGVAIDITESYIWIALIKSNTLVVIKDKPFIQMMKQLYLKTWQAAEKV